MWTLKAIHVSVGQPSLGSSERRHSKASVCGAARQFRRRSSSGSFPHQVI
jgi:hypothetical protein